MPVFRALRDANIARQMVWDPSNKIDENFRITELLGEVGEVANLLKKAQRERIGLAGSRMTKNQLAEELADVAICTDLAALSARTMLREYYKLSEPAKQEPTFYARMLGYNVGKLCSIGLHPDPSMGIAPLAGLWRNTLSIALLFEIDLRESIVSKFNSTSEKLLLNVFMDK